MISNENLTNAVLTGISTGVSTVAGCVSRAIGHNWMSISGGFGFGLVQGISSTILHHALPGNSGSPSRFVAAEVIASGVTVGLTHLAAGVGIIAAPVSIPTGIALTVAIIALKLFITKPCFHACKNANNYIAHKHEKIAKKIAEEAQVKQQQMVAAQ